MSKRREFKNPWGERLRGFLSRAMKDSASTATRRGYAYICRKLIKWKPHLWNGISKDEKKFLESFKFDEPRSKTKTYMDLLKQKRRAREDAGEKASRRRVRHGKIEFEDINHPDGATEA